MVVKDKEGECTRLFMYSAMIVLEESETCLFWLQSRIAVECSGTTSIYCAHFILLNQMCFPQKLSLYVLSVSPS